MYVENQEVPQVVSELDLLRLKLSIETLNRLATQKALLEHQLQTTKDLLVKAEKDGQEFQRGMAETYKLVDGDSIDPESGKIVRK